MLSCFNDFRLCTPLCLFNQVVDIIKESLRKLAQLIELYFKKEKNTFDLNEATLFNCFLTQFAYELLPFIEKCLGILFPINELQSVLSVPQVELEKLKDMFKLDINLIFGDCLLSSLPIQQKEEHDKRIEETLINQNSLSKNEEIKEQTNISEDQLVNNQIVNDQITQLVDSNLTNINE
jgi:hypothetical protein